MNQTEKEEIKKQNYRSLQAFIASTRDKMITWLIQNKDELKLQDGDLLIIEKFSKVNIGMGMKIKKEYSSEFDGYIKDYTEGKGLSKRLTQILLDTLTTKETAYGGGKCGTFKQQFSLKDIPYDEIKDWNEIYDIKTEKVLHLEKENKQLKQQIDNQLKEIHDMKNKLLEILADL